jgi:hypothetical protein
MNDSIYELDSLSLEILIEQYDMITHLNKLTERGSAETVCHICESKFSGSIFIETIEVIGMGCQMLIVMATDGKYVCRLLCRKCTMIRDGIPNRISIPVGDLPPRDMLLSLSVMDE